MRRASLLIAFLFLLCWSLAAHAQGWCYSDFAAGNIILTGTHVAQPLAAATVTVCTAAGTGIPCVPLASIFSDVGLTVPKADPITTDANGNFTFCAAQGTYVITIQATGFVPYSYKIALPPGGGGGNTPFDQCTAANQTDNSFSFWTVQPMTQWDAGHWEFVAGHAGEIYCTVRVPDSFVGNPMFIHLEMGTNAPSGVLHMQTCDTFVAPGGTFNPTGHGGTGTFNLADTTVCQPSTIVTMAAGFTRFSAVFALKSVPVKDSIIIVEIHSDGAGALSSNLLLFGEYLENE